MCMNKGTVARDFLLLVFSWINFSPAPELSTRTISNFFKNSRKYSQVKVHHRYQRHRQQSFPPFSLVLLITVANNGNNYQTADNLKWTWRKKKYIYVNSTIQSCPNKIIKFFLIEDFFHLPPVSTTPVVHLELRISPRIFEKNRNGSNGIPRALGETDSWKKPEVKNLVTLSL